LLHPCERVFEEPTEVGGAREIVGGDDLLPGRGIIAQNETETGHREQCEREEGEERVVGEGCGHTIASIVDPSGGALHK
jgi:hypothetical protein